MKIKKQLDRMMSMLEHVVTMNETIVQQNIELLLALSLLVESRKGISSNADENFDIATKLPPSEMA